MEKLRFPIIRNCVSPEPKALSMEEYLRFVIFNLKYAVNRKIYRRLKKAQAVKTPFRLLGE